MKEERKVTSFQLRVGSLEQYLLFLFLLLIPTQIGKHFWPEWSYVMGMRVDYLSPTIYFIDLIWSLWLVTKIYNLKFIIFKRKDELISFQNILVALFVVVNILIAGNKWVAVYKWLRIGQWMVTYKLFRYQISDIRKYLLYLIPVWVGLESLLGLAQMVKGGSLQGIFYWLGERSIDFNTIGAAQISVAGNGLIRAYGTFSHPNSLAGFLLISLIIWQRYKNLKFKIFNLQLNGIVWWVVFWLGVVGIIVTGSRTVWVVSIVTLIIFNFKFIIYNFKKSLGWTAVLIGMVVIVLGVIGVNYRISDFLGGWDSDSLNKRINLNIVGLKMWSESPFLGIGAGNFLTKLPEYQNYNKFYWLQPIHNIFLLVGVEMGLLGMILLVKFIIFNLQFINLKKNWLVLGVIVITGMVDHYWITLPQNSWLLLAVLATL